MFEYVLIAAADARLERDLRFWLETVIGLKARIDGAETAAAANEKIAALENPPQLVIVDLALPLDGQQLRDHLGTSGLDFVESNLGDTCTIVVSQFETDLDVRRRIDRLFKSRLFPYGDLPEDQTLEFLEGQLQALWMLHSTGADSPAPPGGLKPIITAEVVFQDDGQANVMIELRNGDVPAKNIISALRPDEYDDLKRLSDMLGTTIGDTASERKWSENAKWVGSKIYSAIFGGEPHELIEYLRQLRSLSDEDVRIRFTLAPDGHGIIFETLASSMNAGFKVLDTPVARQVALQGNANKAPGGIGLKDADEINVLVIAAGNTGERSLEDTDAKDFTTWQESRSQRNDISFRSLKHAALEVAMMERLQSAVEGDRKWRVFDHDERGANALVACVKEVRILDADASKCENPGSFEHLIKETLKRGASDGGNWHIVHYIGHSVAANANAAKAGYLIIPGGMRLRPVPVERFLPDFRAAGTKLLFFSSCEFGSAQVAQATAQRCIPATIGFRWVVGDKAAHAFSQEFYRALFCERLTVDEAVRDARRETWGRLPQTDPVWASAVFTCIGDQWHIGYGEKINSGGMKNA